MRGIVSFAKTSLVSALAQRYSAQHVLVHLFEYPSGEMGLHYALAQELSLYTQLDVVFEFDLNQELHKQVLKLMLLLDMVKHAHVPDVRLVLPYIPYLRQRHGLQHGSILHIIGHLARAASVRQLVTCNPHRQELVEFEGVGLSVVQLDEFWATVITKDFKISQTDIVILAPDEGAQHRAQALAQLVGVDWVALSKQRKGTAIVYAACDLKSLSGKNVFLVDDIIDSGATALGAAQLIRAAGARSLHGLFTFGLFSSHHDQLNTLFDTIVVTDLAKPRDARVSVVSASDYLAFIL